MGLTDLADIPDYATGRNINDSSYIRNLDHEVWIYPLPYNQFEPPQYTVTVGATAIAAGAIEMTVTASEQFTFYVGDTIKFSGGQQVVCGETTIVATTETTVPIYPSTTVEIATAETGLVRPMIPVLSIEDGGGLATDATAAEANNKNQGLYTVRSVVNRNGTIDISGKYNKKDMGAIILNDIAMNTNRSVFVQTRNSPFVIDTAVDGTDLVGGEGNGVIEGVFVVMKADINPGPRNEFNSFDGQLQNSGKYTHYKVLTSA